MERVRTTYINGVCFVDFGSNNYSCGMHLITTEAVITTEQVLNGEFPGVYLNPSAPWNELDHFCVFGTPEQYAEFYKRQREAQISKRRYHEIPVYIVGKEYIAMSDKIEEEYKDWWEK